MQDSDFLCPVCKKYYFEDFDAFETCPECGWEGNQSQFDDHDMSDGRNSLSVNEHKIQYAAMQIAALKPQIKALQRDFLKQRWDIKELMRDFASGSTVEDFKMTKPAFEQCRTNYLNAIKELMDKANA